MPVLSVQMQLTEPNVPTAVARALRRAITKAQTWNRIALAIAHSILNVASIAAFMPIPRLAAYAAAKAYVLSLTESLSQELSGTGVTPTALCPGLTDTAMVRGSQMAKVVPAQKHAILYLSLAFRKIGAGRPGTRRL